MMSFDQFIFEVCEHPLMSAGVVVLSWFFVRRFIRRLFRPRFPQTFTARVTYVCDGDSMWVKPHWGHRTKLRLIGMDAPETEQAFGRDATEVLTKKSAAQRFSSPRSASIPMGASSAAFNSVKPTSANL